MPPLQVLFPGIGTLCTNKVGRLEFEYEPRFLSHLDLGVTKKDEQQADWSVFSRAMPEEAAFEVVRCVTCGVAFGVNVTCVLF